MKANVKEPAQLFRIEPRWPVALAILAVILLLALLPGRLTLFPTWFPYVIGIVVLAPMVAVKLTAAKARWLRVERTITLLFFVFMGVGTLANLANLVGAMVRRSAEISGLQLFMSSIAV